MIYIDVERKMLTTDGPRKLEVCVEIEKRELVCLFGKSGAGKTTLLRMLCGLFVPDKGVIRIGDKTVFDSSKKINIPPQKRNVGYMFQDYALFPNMNVEENIRFAQDVKNLDEVESLLRTFQLEKLRHQKTTRLSGGQKQRVALARAFARKPEVMLLDEPLSSVDFELRQSLQNEIIKSHNLFNATTVMVSHDKDEIHRLATKVLRIGKEKITTFENPTNL
ncbi:MAG: ATP-binding cassette domain-containing protein [Bacteroidota bacterium]|nr:ATP-binding cassette domain-containing protein [Bacteroidota bacterium]